jgi:hypothetical protein
MIEPVAEDRFLSAEEALAVLQGKKELTRSVAPKPNKSSDNPIILMNDGRKLIVVIPPLWFHSNHSLLFALLPLIWNSISLLMIWIAVESRFWIALQFLEFRIFVLMNLFGLLLFSIFELIGLWMLGTFLLSAASRTRLEINQQNFRLQRCFFNWCYREIWGWTEISRIELNRIGLSMNKSPITVCSLKVKQSKYRFGSFLAEPEKEWLVAQVNGFLDKQQIIGKKSG